MASGVLLGVEKSHTLAVLTLLLLAFGYGPSGSARAAPPAVPDAPSGTVAIVGDVATALTLTAAAGDSCEQRTEAVTFRTGAGPQQHTYGGCPLEELLVAAEPIGTVAAAHPLLTVAVVATAADGYAATLSWADISARLAARPALVAWSEDGTALLQPRLVLPADPTGARYVTDLIELRVVQPVR